MTRSMNITKPLEFQRRYRKCGNKETTTQTIKESGVLLALQCVLKLITVYFQAKNIKAGMRWRPRKNTTGHTVPRLIYVEKDAHIFEVVQIPSKI